MVDTFRRIWLTAVVVGFFSPLCHGAWFDSAWQYRRGISITWDDDHPSGEDLASCVFYTDGHALPQGEDIRVATEDGRLVASHVLTDGPGDRYRVVFSMVKNVRDYQIYFGNPHPKPAPEGMDDVHYRSGVLLETRVWTGGGADNFEQMEKSWARSKPVLGKMMVENVFLGYNPFGPQEQWISKFSGSLFAPMDGDYFFALAADDDGALYIDGRPLLFAPLGGADIRYHATLHLYRGRHDLVVYHVNKAQQAYISLGWRPPNAAKVTIINRESFGICYSGLVGPLEEHGKTLVADFAANQSAECFLNDTYSFRYHFAGRFKEGQPVKYQWDFGDGQTSTQPEVDHVYFTDGIYPVKLTARLDGNTDTQTIQLPVSRNYAHILDAKLDTPTVLSGVLQDYNLQALSSSALERAMQIHLAAERFDSAVSIADKIAGLKHHDQPDAVITDLTALQRKLIDIDQVEKMVEVWDQVPADSDLQPAAARRGAELAMWWTGDFDKAVRLLKPIQDHAEPPVRRMYAEALIVAGSADQSQKDQGRKILEGMRSSIPANRKAALSGASARSVEFFITEKDADAGEEAWERWQQKFPTDFLEGYSVMLRTKLMELRKRQPAAAKLAEAFATAQPLSPYAPQLLDRASKLLAASDPTKSAALHQLLKQKYPEDPLSQN